MIKGVQVGSGNAVKDTYEGIFHEGFLEKLRRLNPVYSVRKDMPKYMWKGVKEAWDRNVVYGDVVSRTEIFTDGLRTIGIGLIGDKVSVKLEQARRRLIESVMQRSVLRLKEMVGTVKMGIALGMMKF